MRSDNEIDKNCFQSAVQNYFEHFFNDGSHRLFYYLIVVGTNSAQFLNNLACYMAYVFNVNESVAA